MSAALIRELEELVKNMNATVNNNEAVASAMRSQAATIFAEIKMKHEAADNLMLQIDAIEADSYNCLARADAAKALLRTFDTQPADPAALPVEAICELPPSRQWQRVEMVVEEPATQNEPTAGLMEELPERARVTSHMSAATMLRNIVRNMEVGQQFTVAGLRKILHHVEPGGVPTSNAIRCAANRMVDSRGLTIVGHTNNGNGGPPSVIYRRVGWV